jgi:hypothetical protein
LAEISIDLGKALIALMLQTVRAIRSDRESALKTRDISALTNTHSLSATMVAIPLPQIPLTVSGVETYCIPARKASIVRESF